MEKLSPAELKDENAQHFLHPMSHRSACIAQTSIAPTPELY